MAQNPEKETVQGPKLFEDKGMEDDEVVFNFEQATEDNESFVSLSAYTNESEQTGSNELYVPKAFLCFASPVFEAMLSHESTFEESKGVVHICDYPRRSYLAFFYMIYPRTFKQPSRNWPYTYCQKYYLH